MANKTVSHNVRKVDGITSKDFDVSLLSWDGTHKPYPVVKGNKYSEYSEMSVGIKYKM